MDTVRDKWVRCLSGTGFHQMAYREWGATDNPDVLFCVHGLTRCSHDFDTLAAAMADRYRVICPDVVGRGRSDWLRDKLHYGVPQYCSDMTTLLAQVNGAAPIANLHWVGTSMGGLIGMALAAQPESPITRLVLNDVGPVVSAISIQRIGEYVGKAPRFPDYAAAEAFVRAVSVSFGRLSDAQWKQLTEPLLTTAADGALEFRYDPGIAQTFKLTADSAAGKDIELWPLYNAITCPTLLLRGAESDLLASQTALAMTQCGPRAKLVEFAGVGHAPALMDTEQISPIREFLMTQ